jgi:hypothetical protein
MPRRGGSTVTGQIRRHRPRGGTWGRPRPGDDADATRILAGLGRPRGHVRAAEVARIIVAAIRPLRPGRHGITDTTTPHQRASIHVDTAALDADTVLDLIRTAEPPAADRGQLAEILTAHRETTP